MENQIERKYFDYVAVPDKETRAFLKKKAEYGKAILKRTAQGVWEMGELLTQVKERLPHGDFGKWIEAELGITRQSANSFMQVYSEFPQFPQMSNNLTFEVAPTVLYLLAKPSVSDETRELAMERIASGELKTTADAKAVIEAKKPQVVEAEIVTESNMQNLHNAPVTGNPIPETNPTLDNAHNDDILDDFEDELVCGHCSGSSDDVNEINGDGWWRCSNCAENGPADYMLRYRSEVSKGAASRLTVDDLKSIPLTNDPATLAANATVVSDTIGEPDPAAPQGDEDELTDDEWLMTLPIFRHFVARGNKALLLRADALAWRTMQQTKAFGSFRHHAQKAFDFNAARTPLAHLIYKASHVRHPKEWGGCVSCRGNGCTICGYTGAVTDGGLTIEQMEARK